MITENQLEQQCLDWFRSGGWDTPCGPEIVPDGAAPERANYREVVLVRRPTHSLTQRNLQVSVPVLDKAMQRPLTEAYA